MICSRLMQTHNKDNCYKIHTLVKQLIKEHLFALPVEMSAGKIEQHNNNNNKKVLSKLIGMFVVVVVAPKDNTNGEYTFLPQITTA